MSTAVHKLKRGDRVIALKHIDEEAADVRPGTLGIVFEEQNAYGDRGGPMVAWVNMGTCNVYNGDVELVHKMVPPGPRIKR